MMNNNNEISRQTKLYGFIGVEAGVSSISATLNKLYKAKNTDAMMIPMNIREDDFYFTLANMKKSQVNGSLISNEYVTDVVELLDESSELVRASNMCDIVLRNGEKLYGDIVFVDALLDFLKKSGAKKIALLGVNHFAKAFVLKADRFDIAYFNDDLELLMKFITQVNVKDANINRIADGMSVDLSSYDCVVDFSNLSKLSMIEKLGKINLDMKQKKQFSALKIRVNELNSNYIGFENMLVEISDRVLKFYKDKG